MATFRPYNFIKDGYIADIVSSTLVYHGFYNPDPQTLKVTALGALDTSKAQFSMVKETRSVSGDTTKMEWAYTDGQPMTYNQIWDNRATSVTYR